MKRSIAQKQTAPTTHMIKTFIRTKSIKDPADVELSADYRDLVAADVEKVYPIRPCFESCGTARPHILPDDTPRSVPMIRSAPGLLFRSLLET